MPFTYLKLPLLIASAIDKAMEGFSATIMTTAGLPTASVLGPCAKFIFEISLS